MHNRTIRLGLAPLAALAAILAPNTVAMAGFPTPSPTTSPSPSASPSPSPSPLLGPWRQQTTPTEEHLHGIFAFDGCHAWALGEEVNDTSGQSTIIATTDGGKTWTPQAFPTGSAVLTTMNRVFFTDATHGYAVGENNGTVQRAGARAGRPRPAVTSTPGPNVPNFLVTSDGGKTWIDKSSKLPAEVTADSNADTEGLTAVGDKVWIATESDGADRSGRIVFSADRGETWTIQKTVTSGAAFSSVSMFDANNGFAVSDDFTSTPGTGNLWYTLNGGANWTKTFASLTNSPEQVWATGTLSAVIAEDGGTIDYTSTAGLIVSPATIAPATTEDLTDIAFGDAKNGVATGELNGNVLVTADGGKNWTTQDANAGANNFNGATMAKGTGVAFVTGEGGIVSGNTSPTVGCVAAAQLPANTNNNPSPTSPPGLPKAGLGDSVTGALALALGIILLMGLGVGGRVIAQRVRSRV